MTPISITRFATCTPVAFHANESFYTRDTGLICREIRRLGHECRVIMPLPAREDDLPTGELLRTPMSNLYRTAWWRSQKIQAVVLYSWGDPRYTGIARAIRRAGLRLIIHFDSSGELHEHLQRQHNRVINRIKDYIINRLRCLHLSYADYITTSAPCINRFLNDSFYGDHIAKHCVEFPAPVNNCFHYQGGAKEMRIICTGNWREPVKRVHLLMRTLELLLTQNAEVKIDICGMVTPELKAWHAALHHNHRVLLHGMCNHDQLAELNNRASISLCTSESEGSHGASAEALCCGCSIVCPPRPLLRVVQWYTQHDSGTIANDDTAEALCAALQEEADLWLTGKRNAAEIATTWHQRFNPHRLLQLH